MPSHFRAIVWRYQNRLLDWQINLTKRIINDLAKSDASGRGGTNDLIAQLEAKKMLEEKKWLYAAVGEALSQWARMEDLLVAIASLLLRTHEVNKVGIILYSIINFNVWLDIIEELFTLEPIYTTLKPRWNKLGSKLKGLKNTRDRLAHHTIYYGDNATTLAGDISLRPGQFDIRQKSQKYQPMNYDQTTKFTDSVINLAKDLTALLNAMTSLLKEETSQKKSSEPTPDQHLP
jgi:hypothetical protein